MKNVQIPIDLFHQIIELLGYWDTSKYDISIQDDYNYIVDELNKKRQKMELRETYKNVITAPDEDSRTERRIDYLKEKSHIPGN